MRESPARWWVVAAALACLVAGGARAEDVYVAQPRADAELEPVAAGLALWLKERLSEAGLAARREPTGLAPATPDALRARAAELGANWVAQTELRLEEDRVRLWLGLFAGDSELPLAVAQTESPLAELGAACRRAVESLGTQLGLPPGSLGAAVAPSLDELAASSRALAHADAGRLAEAWNEVAGRLTPLAMGLREEIGEMARDPRRPELERARVLAASGDARSAAGLIAHLVDGPSRQDPAVLVAAGEVRLAAGALGPARAHFEAALARDPSRADAQLGLARTLAAQQQTDPARAAFARAAKLAPSQPRPLLELAELEADDPRRRAELLVEAGRRAAAQLDTERAGRYLQRAVRLEPSVAAQSWRATADLERRLGRPRQALGYYSRAEQAGVGDVALFRNMARAQRALGEREQAERSFREALALDAGDRESLRGLGNLYVESGRAEEAVTLLRRALDRDPRAAGSRHDLARALHATDRSDEALELLAGVDSADALRQTAIIQQELGRRDEAHLALSRAVALEPHSADLHASLAELHAADGDADAAAASRETASLLEGDLEGLFDASPDSPAQVALSFESLVSSFSGGTARRVARLGVRRAPGWKELAFDWLHPWALDRRALGRALDASLAGHFDRVERPSVPRDTLLADTVESLYDFAGEASLDAGSIAAVNQALGSDAVFVAVARRVLPEPGEEEAATCSGASAFELELRMLAGQQTGYVEILSNLACPEEGLQVFGAWNPRALGVYAALLVLLLTPMFRGWGTVQVRIQLPPRTKGFLSLRIARSPVSAEKKRQQRLSGLRRLLNYLSRYRRHMVGRETVFRWIPARREPYYVTLMGPLKEAAGSEIIGHFLEEQRLRVKRGTVEKLEFDLQPKECAVEVRALVNGTAAKGARVAVKGDPRSLRYAPGGKAFLYLGKGEYVVLVGAGERVAEAPVAIRTLEKAIPVCIDLGNPERPVFQDCADAVEPYLQGDFAGAADALDRAGQDEAAHLARAEHHRLRGDEEAAAAAFEAAGRLEDAAELRGDDSAASAALFERAGDHGRAAETYRAAGELAAAARSFEAAYDFDNALECYREVGDTEKVIELLERTGEYLDAALLARDSGDSDRAVRNLQQIARNDSSWGDGCAVLGEILAERGDHDVAIESFQEALHAAGGDQAPAELQERYALLLEKCGEREMALTAWIGVARRDPSRQDVSARIAELRSEVERTRPSATAPTVATASEEVRYELLEELGRGGMGVVYKARDRRLERMVALKQLPANLRDHPDAMKLFLREAQSAASLNHRNIVTVHDAGEENGTYYIAMELLEGLPLDQVLARRKVIGAKDVARLGTQVAAGLDYAHGHRVVHRDIKVGNLFFTQDRCVKIMDFGLAKTIEEVRRNSTMIGGTPFYMAPEQAAGEAVDHRADLYAFGVTLFKLATGAVPFAEGDLGYHHRNTPPPDPREIQANVPEALAQLILELMAKSPDDRPQSAGDVATRLQQIVASS